MTQFESENGFYILITEPLFIQARVVVQWVLLAVKYTTQESFTRRYNWDMAPNTLG